MCKTLVPVVVFCLLFLLAASAYSQETVTLTVNSSHGSPEPSAGDHSYLKGTPVTATVATPVGGGGGLIRYACVGWKLKYSSPPTGTTNTVTFTINKNSILTWKWKAQYLLTLNVEPAGAGHIDFYCDSHPEEPSGTYPPTEGGWWTILRIAQLNAVADEGYDFANWSGGSQVIRLEPTKNPTVQKMRRPETVIANFTPQPRTLTVYSDQGEPVPAVGTYTYYYDQTVTANCGPDPSPADEGMEYVCTGYEGTGDLWLGGSETSVSFVIHNDSSVTWLWQLQTEGDRIYVDGANGDDTNDGLSWATAKETIQAGLDAAGATGWTVLVANGTYTGTGNKDLDFSGKAIYLKSVGGAANCPIDCENSGRGFYFHSGETAFAVIEGFTIRNGNAGYWGGGVLCWYSSSPTFTNCTISGNSAYWGGGVSCEDSSSLTFRNSIIWGNTAGIAGHQIYVWDGCSVTLSYSCYANGANDVAGSGTVTPDNCINDDPEFVGGGDYHLQSTSPCIDIGNNSYVPAGVTTDLAGSPRIVDGDGDYEDWNGQNESVDMGAYEHQP